MENNVTKYGKTDNNKFKGKSRTTKRICKRRQNYAHESDRNLAGQYDKRCITYLEVTERIEREEG